MVNDVDDVPTSFRCNRAVLQSARDRLKGSKVRFPDAMRLAVQSIADGDVSMFGNFLSGFDVPGSEAVVNSGWLYRKCVELFTYRDGKLIRNAGKGQGKAGDEVAITMREGVPSVVVMGEYFPMKDIVWLMVHGELIGEVINKNGNVTDNSIDNLMLNPRKHIIQKVKWKVSKVDVGKILSGKKRALIISCAGQSEKLVSVIERLINTGEAFHFILSDDDGWIAVRRGIYAERIEGFNGLQRFVVSIS
ncbi:hypothetical protein JY462_07715 [Serratia marcescens]|nr:hypothetical protein [Serratia marcescens]